MLEVKDLTINVNLKILIEKLSFSLNKGDKMAIIGEEGNGKSTLLKVIAGIGDYADTTGFIDLKHNKVGYLKQFFNETELNMLGFDYLFVNQDEYYEKIKSYYRYLNELNIKEDIMNLPIYHLSGGEKVKIGIIKLLLSDCDILLLDEPSNDLDLETLNWLENFINSIDKPIMYISHDETLLSRTANMILHIEQVKKKQECKCTVLKSNYDDYINSRLNKIAKETQQARSEQKAYDKQMQKLTQIKQKVDYQLKTITRADAHGAQLLKKKMKSIKSQERRITNEEHTQMPDYEESINLFFEDASVPARKEILNIIIPELVTADKVLVCNIDLKVYGNKHIVIVGKNGIGKTTLMRRIYDLLKNRKDIKVGYMPQFYDDIFSEYQAPLDYICPGGDKETVTKIRSYLGNLNITSEEMTQEIKYLSGGTKAKILLLKLVIDKCNVLLLDEPTRNLSPLSNPVIRRILANFQGTIISVSHDRKYISEVCDTIYELTESGLKEVAITDIIMI